VPFISLFYVHLHVSLIDVAARANIAARIGARPLIKVAVSKTSHGHFFMRVLAVTYVFLWVAGALALDPSSTNITNSTNACGGGGGSNFPPIFHLTTSGQQALFWSSTALAILVSFVQGGITTLIDICEAESLWTVRFRLAVYEHYWWTVIAVALLTSFIAMIFTFLAGNIIFYLLMLHFLLMFILFTRQQQ
jgi:hypothetical protein